MAIIMEGPLSKWTNVMKGWQYRWFVLDENSALLSYYTSKEKMMRGSRRGCVRLKGAIIGIDDEDDSTFTLTVDQKTFHFQARDADEREKWIEALESTILRCMQSSKGSSLQAPSAAVFDHKLAEADAYLQILITQVKHMENCIDACEDAETQEKYIAIKTTAEAMIESIKHSIVMLQISKESINRQPLLNGTPHDIMLPSVAIEDHYSSEPLTINSSRTTVSSLPTNGIDNQKQMNAVGVNGVPMPTDQDGSFPNFQDEEDEDDNLGPNIPAKSYSSSEDEDFFDAEDLSTPRHSPEKGVAVVEAVPEVPPPTTPPVIITTEDDYDYYDELYDDIESEGLESLDKHGSIITHLLSQVRLGMDLTKVVLPTFILERKSLLEMYAEFFAHPDLFVQISEHPNPRERMVQTVRWYLSAFHASRNSEIAKKPYNPILGEIFRSYCHIPGTPRSTDLNEHGPVPWASKDNLSFIAEQVSHHPPISAFYAEHYNNRISLDGYTWTKSKFLGLSIGVHMIGQAVVSVLDYDEEYILTFPNGYGRSILTVPWIELGGKITVTCAKSGYSANIEFHTKPFYGGKKHRTTAEIFAPGEKKPFCNVEGEWNGVMYAKFSDGHNEVFVDTKQLPVAKKQVKDNDSQTEFESRKLWRNVTYHLKNKNVDEATEYKRGLEQRQRDEAKERKERGVNWDTKYFHEVGEHWVYDEPLLKRLTRSSTTLLNSNSSEEAEDSEEES